MQPHTTDHTEDDAQYEDQTTPVTKPITARINPLATLIAGLLMGALVGYAGRPLLTSQPPTPTPVTSASNANPSASSNANPSAGNPSSATLMDAVVAQTRHFRGDPNAPVIVIEFGDFQ